MTILFWIQVCKVLGHAAGLDDHDCDEGGDNENDHFRMNCCSWIPDPHLKTKL